MNNYIKKFSNLLKGEDRSVASVLMRKSSSLARLLSGGDLSAIKTTINKNLAVMNEEDLVVPNVRPKDQHGNTGKIYRPAVAQLPMLWRKYVLPSGSVPAPATIEHDQPELIPGLTALIRAKNEQANTYECISRVSQFVDQVIFVDNNSTDATFVEAQRAQQKKFNTRIYQYNIDVPRLGADHAAAVAARSANTLATYYNFCLSKVATQNVIKWDADFVAIDANLRLMIEQFDLRTRADCFTLWCGGASIWTDGQRFWHETESRHNEFRCHSKLHGMHWVDLPEWEEVDQAYLYMSQKLTFLKPVYAEIVKIDPELYARRGINLNDKRDRDRFEAIEYFKQHASLPSDRFVEIDGLDQASLSQLSLSAWEIEAADYMKTKYNAVPEIISRATGEKIVPAETLPQPTLGVFCISHKGNYARQDMIRHALKPQFDKLRIPFYFVVGDPTRSSHLSGDTLFVNWYDNYEGLAGKVCAVCRYFADHMNLEFMLKIDDDVVLSAERLINESYWEHDYYGGAVAGGSETVVNWHQGKCQNHQLDQLLHSFAQSSRWYGGGYGYFLSKKAASVIAENEEEMRSSLYEDCAVADVLGKHGLFDAGSMPVFGMMDYPKWEQAGRPVDIIGVTDCPAEAYWEVANLFDATGIESNFNRIYYINTDWYNWDEYWKNLRKKKAANGAEGRISR